MRFITFYLLTIVMTVVLSGCGDKYAEIKEAASGFNSKASEATTAISADVHAIRATELSYKEHTFTMNDVFKTILRDVQWFYDEETSQLKITRTWRDNGLFAQQQFDDETKKAIQHECILALSLLCVKFTSIYNNPYCKLWKIQIIIFILK